jgi:ribonucrease Y
MNEMMIVVVSIVGLFIGFAVAYFVGNKVAGTKIVEAEKDAKKVLKDADKEANNIKKEKLLEVKEEWHKRKQDFESETQSKRAKLQVLEKQVKAREDGVDGKVDTINKKEKKLHMLEQELNSKDKNLVESTKKLDELIEKEVKQLEHISGLTREDAKKYLVDNYINDAKTAAASKIKRIKEEAKLNAQREAQTIIIQAIQRTASDHSVESTVSVVNLDSDDMKGRIIGREGRNIRAFEAATGIDLIIDDTPEAVVISGFDPFRREIAKRSLEKLMTDGRIHPARIEEIVNKTREEMETEIIRLGENASIEIGIHNVHNEILRLIGKMRYRSSYGQNLLSHSIEVAHLCGLMASELGLDPTVAKRAGLFHDMGKCVDQNTEGPHALIGFEIAKKCKENKVISNAIGAHHEDIEMETPYAVLVQAADSISGARPGARRESLENYIKRLEKLESLANSKEGVSKTFAIQAGREIRVIVEPERVNDQNADIMAQEIADSIEAEMEYPGQIKVTVVRERRSVALAK